MVILVFSYWALAHGCCFDPQIKVKQSRPPVSLEIEEACTCGPAAWGSRRVVLLLCFVIVVRRRVIKTCWLSGTFSLNFDYVLDFNKRGTPPLNLLMKL